MPETYPFFREKSEFNGEVAAIALRLNKQGEKFHQVLEQCPEHVSAAMLEGLEAVVCGDFIDGADNVPTLREGLTGLPDEQFEECAAALFCVAANRPEGFQGVFGVLGRTEAGNVARSVQRFRDGAFPEIDEWDEDDELC